MKKNHPYLCLPALVLVGVLATVNYGCGKKPASSAGEKPAGESKTPAFVSAEKTSFTEVTSQLDPGGNFYLYLGTAQWLEHLSGHVEAWRATFTAMPALKPGDTAKVNKAFDIVTRLIKDSGVEDISGVGMSSIEIENGLYRNKVLMHHYPGTGTGFLWKLCGKEPHALTGLDLLPADTVLAVFSDADLPLLWTVAKDEVGKSDLPRAQQFFATLPAEFEKRTKVKWDDFLNSLGGEFGFVLTLNPSNNIPVPLPSAGLLQIPEPGLLLAVKVNDDTIFNRIDQELKTRPQVISVDQPGLKMRTLPIPIPFVGNLRPTTATSGGYLFIATSDALVQEALAVKSGKTPGLKTTAEFKRLAQNLPEQGNQFAYVSERFSRTLMQIQQQAIAGPAAKNSSPAQAQWLQSLFKSRAGFAYSVGVNTDSGCLTVGNGSQSYATVALMPAVAISGMMAAIAIPNFVKARAVSQKNACINNLRQIDAAKNEWALEKGKKDGDVPTQEDLMPYLRKWPVCPQGGTYTINAIGRPPECSIPGHTLP